MGKTRIAYEASPAEKIDLVPPGLRPEIRQTRCRKCKRRVILHQPAFDKVQTALRGTGCKLAVMCPDCIAKLRDKVDEYYELYAIDPRVSRELCKAEAELN